MGVRVNHKQIRTLPPGGLIIAINLQSSPDVVLGVRHPPLLLTTPAPLLHSTPAKKQNASELDSPNCATALHFRDIQSDHSIATMGWGRLALLDTSAMEEWSIQYWTNALLTSMTTRLRLSASASLPLHPYNTGGSTAQGPGTNPHTNRSFNACELLSLVSVIKIISITSILAKC